MVLQKWNTHKEGYMLDNDSPQFLFDDDSDSTSTCTYPEDGTVSSAQYTCTQCSVHVHVVP